MKYGPRLLESARNRIRDNTIWFMAYAMISGFIFGGIISNVPIGVVAWVCAILGALRLVTAFMSARNYNKLKKELIEDAKNAPSQDLEDALIESINA